MTHIDEMTSPKPLIIIIWTCHEMMTWMRKELIGSLDVIMLILAIGSWQMTADFCPAPTTILTQHDSHGPDDHPKTFDYHHYWTCQKMMAWMRMELIRSLDVIMLNFALW
jgi:hypothetical protein